MYGGIRSRLGFEMIAGFAKRQAEQLRNLGDRSGGEFRMGVDAGADGRATERQLLQARRRRFNALDTQLDLTRIAAEFLSEPDRCRIREMRAADLDHVVEFRRLAAERRVQPR